MDAAPSPARLAATVLVVRDDPFEVLMVRRNARATIASALVFPGGGVDPTDRDEAWTSRSTGHIDSAERAIRIAAIRETWEECGLLVATTLEGTGTGTGPAAATARTDTFRGVIDDADVMLRLEDIHPFAHWITPEHQARRFDTRFFLTRAPRDQIAIADGDETIALEWVSPAAAVARTLAGDRSIIFPTLLNLMRLAESHDSASAIEAAAIRPTILVQPRVERRADSSTWISISKNSGYPVSEYRAD